MRTVLRLLFPSSLLFAGFCYLQFFAGIPSSLQPYLSLYPWLVAVTGVLLGWRFNISRMIYVLLLLVGSAWALQYQPNEDLRLFFSSALALLIPFNMVVISFWKERGLLSWWSLVRIFWLGGQGAAVWALFQWEPAMVTRWLQWPLLPWSISDWTAMSQLTVLCSLIFLLLSLGLYLITRKPLECGFFWALLAVLVAFNYPGQLTFWFSTAVLLLLVAVAENYFSRAAVDELTELPARRDINEHVMKLGSKYVVGMVAIDQFKKVNDTYGHNVSDQVLRMVASKLRDVSGGGSAFRYGGEEFAVIFPGKTVTVNEAVLYLERVRAQIARTGFVLRSWKRPRKKPEVIKPSADPNRALTVTVSIGVAERDEQNSEIEQVIKAADQALRRAKEGGHNRTCRYFFSAHNCQDL